MNGLCDSQFIIEIIEQLVEINDHEHHINKYLRYCRESTFHQSVSDIKTMDEISDQVLSGLIAVVVEGAGLPL